MFVIVVHPINEQASFKWLQAEYGWDWCNDFGIGMASPVSELGLRIVEYIDPEGFETRQIIHNVDTDETLGLVPLTTKAGMRRLHAALWLDPVR